MARWHTTEFDMLPELAFQPRGSVGKFAAGMTLEGGGGGKTPKADPNIGIAQLELSKLSKQQWEFFTKDIYPQLVEETAKQEARADQQFAMTKEISDFQLGQARDAYRRYEEGAIPAMERLREDANLYDTATEQERLGAQAIGDFKSQAEQMRAQETMRQRSFGIDPTSGAALAGQNSTNVMQAAMQAAAQTQTRQAARDIGLQKQASVYNMYAGLPAQGNASTGISMGAMGQGFGAGQQALGNYGAMGSSLGNAANVSGGMFSSVGQIGVGKYNADVSAYSAKQEAKNSTLNSIGSMAGSAVGAYAAF